MFKDNRLTYIDEEGVEVLCEILFTFESEEFNKNYVLFYPVGSENDEEIEVLAASYTPTPEGDGIGELQDIETEEEWTLIEDVLAQFEDDEDFYDEDFEDEDEEDHDHEDDDDCGCEH